MIELSTGEKITDIMCAASRGFDGLGWRLKRPFERCAGFDSRHFVSVTKTFTMKPRPGNTGGWEEWKLWRTLVPVRKQWMLRNMPEGAKVRAWVEWNAPFGNPLVGWLNAQGLPNPGFGAWMKMYFERVQYARERVIVSVQPNNVEEANVMAQALGVCERLVAIQYNVSSPNYHETQLSVDEAVEMTKILRIVSGRPVLLKVHLGQQVFQIAAHSQEYAEGVSLNAVPASVFFGDPALSPLARYGGGAASGMIAQPYNWPVAIQLLRDLHIPVVAGSIWRVSDREKLLRAGFGAFEYGSRSILSPSFLGECAGRRRGEERQ